MAQNSRVGAEAPGWYRIELILITELFEGWQLFVDGTVIASCGRLEAGAAKAWADVALGRQVAWFPGWPRQENACWYWVAEPAAELSAAEAELVLVQLVEAQAAGDLTRMAAIRARLYPHQLAAVVTAADRELAERLIRETEIALDVECGRGRRTTHYAGPEGLAGVLAWVRQRGGPQLRPAR